MANGGAREVDIVLGAIAGVTATVAMTLAGATLFRRLPRSEQYPLPPRELTQITAERAGVRERLSEPQLQAATLAAHFGFGGAAGALYASTCGRHSEAPMVSGVSYGLAVWTASYLGWVPASRLLQPATDHPLRRNLLMLGIHVVWGAALGLVTDRLTRALPPISAGPLRDRAAPPSARPPKH